MRARQLLQYIIIATAFVGIVDVSYAASNERLRAMYEADQNERKSAQNDFSHIINNDRDRRAAVLSMLQTTKLSSAEDYFHAAMIYQHGTTLEDIRLAYSLINIAVTLQPDQVRFQRLRALAWDRMMMQLHKPQWYGSQTVQHGSLQPWKLYEIDETAVTDQERTALGIPTLAEARADVARRNADLQKEQTSEPEKPKGQAAIKPAVISFQRDPGTGHELLAIDRCLAMFWIRLSDRGLTENLIAQQRTAQPRMMVLRKEERDVLAPLDGKTKLIYPEMGGEACFFDYVAYADENRHLVLDLMLDDKVVPGPTYEVKPYKYFRVRLGQLDTDLQGKQVKLLKAEKIKLEDLGH
ncbi:hypothetical protein ACO0LD_26140 [Undibacterium sp. Ji83W]|uniref:hypothetical protein n=1 Tax=Undibacterium sp. Ji83W TaxID=3413043 RepID=UPI003BF0F95F